MLWQIKRGRWRKKCRVFRTVGNVEGTFKEICSEYNTVAEIN